MSAPVVISDAELTGLLKNVYSQYRMKVQNLVTPLLAQLQSGKAGGARNMRWGGNGVYFDVVTGRPAGSVFSTNGFFPTDTTAAEKQANVGVVRAYTTRQIDGLAFAGTRSKEAAFETITRKTIEEIKDASSQLMQQALHNKQDGVVAIVSSTNITTTTFDAIAPYGITTPAAVGQGGLLLTIGDSIALLSGASGTTVRGRAVITDIVNVGDTATITFAPAITTPTQNDRVVKMTANTSDAYPTGGNAMNGLINITNRGNGYTALHGIDAATVKIWDAIRMVAGTDTPDVDTPTESDIWDLIQLVSARSGKDASRSPNEFLMLTTPGMAKKLMESMVAQRRFTAGEFATTIKGGYKAVEVCGIPCVTDPYCPAGTIYLLHIPSLAWVDAKDWGYVEFEGAGPWRWMQGRDAFETTYSWYGNLACLQRNSHGSITGYTDTKRYTHVV
jgi:hypothetical protein